MSKSKAQGTNWETFIVNAAKALGLKARRLAEGGSLDEGDVEIIAGTHRWVVEGKARAALNVHDSLYKARKKSPGSNVAVAWKRLVRKDGSLRRQPTGEVAIVAITLPEFLLLLTNQKDVSDVESA